VLYASERGIVNAPMIEISNICILQLNSYKNEFLSILS